MNTKKIKLMIDGNYVFHIHEYLKECHNKYIEWGAFKDYIKYFISKHENQDISSSIDAKYFVGTKIISDDRNRDFLYSKMEHASIKKYALPLKSNDGRRGGLKEDAVDVALAVEAIDDYYRARDEDKYSYFFLLAGDSDFVPLIDKLEDYGVKTFLIYIDFSYNGKTTRTAQALLEAVKGRTINLAHIIDERVEDIKKNVLKCYDSNTSLNTSIISDYTNNTVLNNNISWAAIQAAMDKCYHLEGGYVLGAELGVKIAEELQISKIPGKLCTILEGYADKLDIIRNQYGGGEFRVKLKPEIFRKKVLIRKISMKAGES